jgi:hypothetical protein
MPEPYSRVPKKRRDFLASWTQNNKAERACCDACDCQNLRRSNGNPYAYDLPCMHATLAQVDPHTPCFRPARWRHNRSPTTHDTGLLPLIPDAMPAAPMYLQLPGRRPTVLTSLRKTCKIPFQVFTKITFDEQSVVGFMVPTVNPWPGYFAVCCDRIGKQVAAVVRSEQEQRLE